MPEILRALPNWGLALALFGTVVLLVFVLAAVVLTIGSVFARPAPADGPTLAESAEPLLRSRRGLGRFDARFNRFAEGTQLGLDGEGAIGWILFGGAVFAAILYLATFAFVPFIDGVMIALFGLMLGGLSVVVVFYLLRHRRRRAIQEQLPDGCFQLARSLRSGLALPSALQETSHYLPVPLSKLFARLSAALALGEATRPALRRAAADADVTEFDLFAEVLAMASESGGNLPAMLDRLASSIRDRNQYRGFFRSVTALARMAALFLAMAAPATLLLYAAFPEQRALLVRFFTTIEGQAIFLVAFVLEVLGILWILWLLRKQDDY
jgi:Flp pilus assembly protein TadB